MLNVIGFSMYENDDVDTRTGSLVNNNCKVLEDQSRAL